MHPRPAILALLLSLIVPAIAQLPAGPDTTLTVTAVLDSMRSRFSLIEDYQVNLKVRLRMPKLRMPRKRMTLSFRQPDKFDLKARGFAMVPRRGISLSPDSLFQGLDNLQLAGDTLVNDRPALVLWGAGEIGDRSMMAEMLVDRERWVILGAATYTDTLELFRLRTDYAEQEPGIFLPTRTTLNFNFDKFLIPHMPTAHRKRGDPDAGDLPEMANRSGEAEIEFSKYRVNRGLPDELFDSPSKAVD